MGSSNLITRSPRSGCIRGQLGSRCIKIIKAATGRSASKFFYAQVRWLERGLSRKRVSRTNFGRNSCLFSQTISISIRGKWNNEIIFDNNLKKLHLACQRLTYSFKTLVDQIETSIHKYFIAGRSIFRSYHHPNVSHKRLQTVWIKFPLCYHHNAFTIR